nr:hypothetical protein [Tanacetum cinerariifolium]
MGDEHLDIIPETESDEVIKSSVENLVPIPSESEAKDHFEILTNSNDDNSSSDDDSLYKENIEYFIFDFANEEFANELAHIISPLEYDCFYFWNLPDPGELMSVLNSGIRENLSTTCVNLPIEDNHSPLLAYVVWIFVIYLTSKKRSGLKKNKRLVLDIRRFPLVVMMTIIPETESDEVIKSSVENLVPIPSESEGIPDTMCDVHLDNNHTPLEAKDHFEILTNSNDDNSSSDDDSLYKENIEYVEASPHDSELVSLEAAEIVIPEVEEIKDDNL